MVIAPFRKSRHCHIRISDCLELLQTELFSQQVKNGKDVIQQGNQLLRWCVCVDSSVKPTRSANKTVTSGKASVMVVSPAFKRSAMACGSTFKQEALRHLLLGHDLIVEALGVDVKQADFEQVVNPGLGLDQVKRFADEIFRARFERAQLVLRLRGDA